MRNINGFEFLEEFEKLHLQLKNRTTIYLLTSSDDEKDKEKALKFDFVKRFITNL